MKKFVTIISLICALTACAHSTDDNTVATNASNATEAAETPSPQIVKDGIVNVIGQDEFATLVAEWQNVSEWKFKGKRPAIVDFNATWCGPCRKLEPILNELAKEYAGKIDFYSIDVDDNRPLAQSFGISSIPLLLICPVDDTPQALQGLHPKENIIEAIEAITKITQ